MDDCLAVTDVRNAVLHFDPVTRQKESLQHPILYRGIFVPCRDPDYPLVRAGRIISMIEAGVNRDQYSIFLPSVFQQRRIVRTFKSGHVANVLHAQQSGVISDSVRYHSADVLI